MDKISPIKQRILYFIENQGIKKNVFCELTGISYSNLKGKSLYSEIWGTQISDILSNYGEISLEWLITGTGEMLRNTENQPLQSVATPQIEKNADLGNYTIELQKKTIERLEIDLQKCCEEKKALQTGNNVFNK